MKLSLPKILCFCIALFSIIASSFRHDGNASSFTTYNPISHFSPSSDDLANLYTYSNQESFIQNDVQSVHASTLLRIPNALMVLYFGGTREGAADVKIYRSMLYDNARVWSKPEVILTREMLSKYSGKFIKKLGNPVAFSDIHGRIHVFVVGVSLGGWATSKIYQFYYNNNALHYVGVAFDEGGVGDGQALDGESVHEGVVGQRGEAFEGAAHGQVGGAEDIDGVDLLGRSLADGPADARLVGQRLIERVAFGGGELFGVVGLSQGTGEQGDEVGLVNLHGSGDDGSGEAPAPGLVHPGERGAGMGGPEVVFGPKVGTHTSVAVRS